MIRVKAVGERDNIAVTATLISNETVGIVLLLDERGKVVERPHSRFREDGKQVRTKDDLDIPPADYRKIFKVAGAILGKPRRKKAR